jgi:ketosteroid isomerase-like protein
VFGHGDHELDIVRAGFDAHARYDMDGVTADCAPDVEWDAFGAERVGHPHG